IRARAAACATGSPKPTIIRKTPGWKRCSCGTKGAGGADVAAMTTFSDRGNVGTSAPISRSASPAWSAPQNSIPKSTIGPTSWSRNSNSVTTPKSPPRRGPARTGRGARSPRRAGSARRPRRSRPRRGCRSRARPPDQPSDPAAEGEAADAGVADRAHRHREPVLLGGGVEVIRRPDDRSVDRRGERSHGLRHGCLLQLLARDGGRDAPAPEIPDQAGLMFALRWKTLPGSYRPLIRASRSYLAAV